MTAQNKARWLRLSLALALCALPSVANAGRAIYEVADINGTGESLTHTHTCGVFVPLGQRVFFWADDGGANYGRELYVTNRVADTVGATLVANINGSTAGSNVDDVTAYGNYIFFTAEDSAGDNELWKTDGSTTSRVVDLYAGSIGSHPANLTVVGDSLYFTAKDSDSGFVVLWILTSPLDTVPDRLISETQQNPVRAYYLRNSKELTEVNGALYLQAKGTRGGSTGSYIDLELWRVSGTNTAEIDINSSSDGAQSSPRELVEVGTKLYCIAYDDNGIEYIFDVDGATETRRAGVSAAAHSLTGVDDGTVYYVDGALYANTQLYRLDSGTASTAITEAQSNPELLTAVGNTLYFTARDTGTPTIKYKRQLHMFTNGDTISQNATRVTTFGGTAEFIENRSSSLQNCPLAVDTLGRVYFVGTVSSSTDIYIYDDVLAEAGIVGLFDGNDSMEGTQQLVVAAGGDIYFPGIKSGNAEEPWGFTSGSTMPIKDSAGNVLACFYANGDLVLTGENVGNTGLTNGASEDLLIKDRNGVIKARIDNDGDLHLAGTLTENMTSIDLSSDAEFAIKDLEGNIVLVIDESGNLKTIGEVFENDVF